jgi:hypothetical protein
LSEASFAGAGTIRRVSDIGVLLPILIEYFHVVKPTHRPAATMDVQSNNEAPPANLAGR